MKSFTVLLLAAIWSVAALAPHAVQASPLLIPASVYPPGAHITYRPVLTNAEVDCLWGFICESGRPNFHAGTQGELQRVSGWGQFAGVQHHGRMTMAFELFVSRYGTDPDATRTTSSERAFLDLKAAIHAKGYRLNRRDAALLLSARQGGTLVAVQRSGGQDLVVMATWSGTLEIEGIALYDHRPPAARQTAWASLARQIHLASTQDRPSA